MTMLSAMLFLTITVGGIRLANINEGLAHNSTANERLSQLMPILNQITESTEQSGTSAAWVNVALQVKTVTWVIDLGGSSTTPTYSVNENVLDFKPCPNMTSSCANKIPTIYANVKLPFSFTKVKGSFVIKSTGSNLADDCYGGPVGGHSAWGPHITGNDGYVMFGTEANIIYGGCRFGKNVGTETVQVDEVEIVPTDTLKVAVAQSHNQEFLTVDISGIEVYGSGSSADDDKHTTINDMLVGIKDSITEERRKASEAEADMCISSVAAGVVFETNINFAGSTVVADDATQYKDLNGCSANSECETETATEAGLAVAAHNEIVRLEADLAVWLTENTTEHGNLKTNQDEKTLIEGKKTTAQTAHTLRLTKFTDAISILKRIDDALDNNGNIVAPAAALVTKEERHAIQQASPVGKAVLLMLNQALSGDVQKDLVITLKKLLQSCMTALESSKAREVTTHADWIVLRDSEITTRTGEITRLTTLLENLATTIANQKVLITTEVTKKSNAVAGLVTKSGACVTGHTNFIGAISDYDTEISAIDEMMRILGEAGLNAETIAIRDEDDSSKHGVKESVSALPTYVLSAVTGTGPNWALQSAGDYTCPSTHPNLVTTEHGCRIAASMWPGKRFINTCDGSCGVPDGCFGNPINGNLNFHSGSGAQFRSDQNPICSNIDLSNDNTGCNGLTTEAECMGSKDGRVGYDFTDSPCDWCCGAECVTTTRKKCEPHSWVIQQPSYTKSKNGAGYDTCASQGQKWTSFPDGNCKCGDRLGVFPSGYGTTAQCGALCVANPRCLSFIIWTNKDLGSCHLFGKPCTSPCAEPTNVGNGYTTDVFNIIATEAATEAAAGIPAELGETLKFTDLKNVTYANGTLTNTDGYGTGWGAGAHSVGGFSANSNVRGIQFRPTRDTNAFMVGLIGQEHLYDEPTGNPFWDDIDFAAYCVAGQFKTYEWDDDDVDDDFKVFGTYKANDKVTVIVNANEKVEYRINDALIYTSPKAIPYPLMVKVGFYQINAAIKDVKWVGE